MDLKKIISITGRPGLYKHIGQGRNKIIVESLTDGKRSGAFSTERMSTLADISVYTEKGEIQLTKILQTMFEKENQSKVQISPKASNEELAAYFENIQPDYDKDRVYPSDIKKIIKWYNLLTEKGLIDAEEPEDQKSSEETKEDQQS